MKSKKLQKKLTLKKQTIALLEDKQQDAILGGEGSFNSICWQKTECGDTCGDTACGYTCDIHC